MIIQEIHPLLHIQCEYKLVQPFQRNVVIHINSPKHVTILDLAILLQEFILKSQKNAQRLTTKSFIVTIFLIEKFVNSLEVQQ